VIKYGYSKDTGNIRHKTQNEDKQSKTITTQKTKDEQHGPHQTGYRF